MTTVDSQYEAIAPLQVRWRGFRGFQDTGWRPLNGLTVLIGPNHAGKTSFLLPLVALKQTLESPDQQVALKLRGDFVDLGSFADLAYLRNNKLEVQMGLRFGYHGPPDEDTTELGKDHPGEIDVTYTRGLREEAVLHTVAINDCYGRTLLRRTRLKDSEQFGLAGKVVSGAHKPNDATNDADAAARKAIEIEAPEHFLFTGEPAYRAGLGFGQNLHEESHGEKGALPDHGPSTEVKQYMRITGYTTYHVQRLIDHIQLMGPIRSRPQRIYELSDERPANVGVDGELAPELLFRADPQLRRSIHRTLRRFGLSVSLEFKSFVRDRAFSLFLRDTSGNEANFADAGFGYSQLLPLLVQLETTKRDSHLLIEQPEIHLNPALQGTFADVVMERVEHGANVVVETHSDHILLRIRRRIAEGSFDPEALNLLYFEGTDEGTNIRRVHVDDRGQILDDEWPAGFFANDVADSIALARAASKKR